MKAAKRLLSLSLTFLVLSTVLCTTAFASNTVEVESETQGTGFTTVASSKAIGLAREDSVGWGYIRSKDPLGAHPQGYAESIMNDNAKAYSISAKISCTDDNGLTYSSEKKTSSNVVSVKSATISSKTSGGKFNGVHTFQKTSSSGLQTCNTSWSY